MHTLTPAGQCSLLAVLALISHNWLGGESGSYTEPSLMKFLYNCAQPGNSSHFHCYVRLLIRWHWTFISVNAILQWPCTSRISVYFCMNQRWRISLPLLQVLHSMSPWDQIVTITLHGHKSIKPLEQLPRIIWPNPLFHQWFGSKLLKTSARAHIRRFLEWEYCRRSPCDDSVPFGTVPRLLGKPAE